MATVEGVTKANETDRTFDVVQDILQNNVTDPKTGRTVTDFIQDGDPNPNRFEDCKAESWTYPIIILRGPNSNRVPLTVDRFQTISKGTVTMVVEVKATEQEEMRTLTDDVMNAMYSNASELSKGALQNMELIDSSNDTEFFGQKKVRIKILTFQFSRID